MDWTQTLTIIASIAGILTGYAFLFDKRFVDLHKCIDDTNKRIDRLEGHKKRTIGNPPATAQSLRSFLQGGKVNFYFSHTHHVKRFQMGYPLT